MDGKSITN